MRTIIVLLLVIFGTTGTKAAKIKLGEAIKKRQIQVIATYDIMVEHNKLFHRAQQESGSME